MTESGFVTRCPKCETTFRVTEKQLAAAHGAVRCGACLQVFAANDHLIESGPFPLTAGISTPITELDSPLQSRSHEQNGGSSNEMELEIESDPASALEEPENQNITQVEDSQQEPASEVLVINTETDRESLETENGEAADTFASSAMFEQRDEQSELVNISGPDEAALDALFEELNSSDEPAFDATEHSSVTLGATERASPEPLFVDSTAVDSVAAQSEKTLDGDEPVSYRPEEDTDESLVQFQEDLSQVEPGVEALEAFDPEETAEPVAEPEVASETAEPDGIDCDEQTESALSHDELEKEEAVPEIQLESVEPEEIVGDYLETVKSYALRWFFAAAVLSFVLAGQFAYVNIDVLVQQPKLRPYYSLFCNYAECKLPAFEDVSLIETTELVVRVHPEVERALLVDAIIRNTSGYRQAFPPLEMKFTDLNNLVIATRKFLPKEYLGGEMVGLKFIPARTEVRLGLEIVDPGETAFGYSLEAVSSN